MSPDREPTDTKERDARLGELETIHAHLPVPLIIVDERLRVIRASRAAIRLGGDSGPTAQQRAVGDAIACLGGRDDPRGCGHGADCGDCGLRRAVCTAIMDDRAVENLPVAQPVATDDGLATRHLLVSAAPVRLAGRRHALVSLQDITPLRRAEADIAFKAMALDQIQDRVTATDLNGRVIYVNNATCRSLRARREDLLGLDVTEFGDDPAEGATQREIIDTTLALGHWAGEVVNLARDGTRAMLHCRTVLIRDSQDVPVGMCGIATDITEAKLRERELRESERRFRSLHEHLPIGYFGLDGAGRYVDANPAWLRLAGLDGANPGGCRFTDRLDEEQAARFEAARLLLVDDHEEQVEIELRDDAGGAVNVLCIGRGHGDGRGGAGVTHWVAADITERRRLEGQLRHAQKMDALGRLAAGVAHDFNNQLTVISGYCDILLESTPPGASLRGAMEQIRLATRRAASTTGHLLAFGRSRELTPRIVDLNLVLREMLPPLGRLVGECISVRMELSPRNLPVRVDQAALEQAVFNLFINARDAMPSGGRIVVRTSGLLPPEAGAAGTVQLVVEDDGHGIAAPDLERVFEPFFSTKVESGGTGLGLPMVKGFAEQSGGAVAISSRPGLGTTITLTLPEASGAAGPAGAPEPAPTAAGLRGRFLVVEDADEVRALVCEVLRQHGAAVAAAASPTAALALAAAEGPFDVLVTDLVMPTMSGDELAACLLARGQVRGVVCMSGHGVAGAGAGATARLAKPFTVHELVVAARSALAAAAEARAGVPS